MRSHWLRNVFSLCLLWRLAAAAKQPDPRILDKRGVTGIAIFTAVFLILVLCFSIFGKRMKSNGIRWFTVNLCLWGLFHMFYITAWRDKDSLYVQALPAWPDWIECELCYQERWALESFQKAVFPFGIVFIILERIVLTLSPKTEDNRAFQLFFAVIFLVFQNMFFAGIWFYQILWRDCKVTADNWMEDGEKPTCLFFDPAELLHMISYVVYIAVNLIFLFFCFIGSCIFCVQVSFQETKRKNPVRTFVDMWLAWLAVSLPHFLHSFLFGSAVVNMIFTAFTAELMGSPLAQYAFPVPPTMSPPTNPPPVSNVTSPGTPPPPERPPPLFTMPSFEQIMYMVNQITMVVPWMVTVLPLFEVLLIVLCFRMYREQLFAFLSCGRIFSSEVQRVYLQDPPLKQSRLSLIPTHQQPTVIQPSAPPPEDTFANHLGNSATPTPLTARTEFQ